MAPMPAQEHGDRWSVGLLATTIAVAVAGIALAALVWSDLIVADALAMLAGSVAGVLYAGLGTLIVRRAGNRIGWLLAGIGLGLAAGTLINGYAIAGVVTYAGRLPAAGALGAIAQSVFVLTASALAFMPFFFPDGALPSTRWRPALLAGAVATLATAVGFLVLPDPLALPEPGGALEVPNPLRLEHLGGAISTLLVATVWVLVITIAAAFAALVLRYRAGGREQRLQIRWVAFVAALALIANVIATGSLVACGCDANPVATVMYALTVVLVFFGIPAALTIAVTKYRLYEIDVIINRTLVYGVLATAVTAVYAAVVIGFGTLIGGRGSPVLTVSAAVAIALLFQPLRHRAQRLANRVVYGERATPYQVLSDFAVRMGQTYAIDDVLERTAAILAQATGATRVDVWLRVGRELRPAASWPADTARPRSVPLDVADALPLIRDVSRAVAVRHDEELLGALTVVKPRSEPLTPTEDELLRDLAAQAGLVLRNVRLATELQTTIDELRASRRRLVEAQDHERRRIERNLHDGAQQQLVALSVQLGLLERLADDPARIREGVARLRGSLEEALDDLRDLARGIYPPLLADKGLAAALDAQARKAAVPTTVETDGIGRYPREVEAAVYFCILEAVQNVAKHADATSAVVRLGERDATVVFEVQDDGRGFDATSATYGTGTQGMIDRLAAVGGRLDVVSEPGRGTTVRGSVAPDPGVRGTILSMTTYRFGDEPTFVFHEDDDRVPGHYELGLSTNTGDRMIRFLTDKGRATILRIMDEGRRELTQEEFDDHTVEPDVDILVARMVREGGEGA